SMRELAAQAGCSPSNLYHHFTSKYEIFFTIIEEAMLLHIAGLEEALQRHDTPVAQLRFVFENHLRLHMERPEVRLLRQDFHPLRGKELERFIAERDRYERGIRAIVARARAEGTFHVQDPKLAVMVSLAACTQVDRWYRPDGELPSDEIARRITDFLIDGFRGRGGAAGPDQ